MGARQTCACMGYMICSWLMGCLIPAPGRLSCTLPSYISALAGTSVWTSSAWPFDGQYGLTGKRATTTATTISIAHSSD
jgi:hypothetical protein